MRHLTTLLVSNGLRSVPAHAERRGDERGETSFLTKSCALTAVAVLSPRARAVIPPWPGILVTGLAGRRLTHWDRRYPQ
jgi:hypothetical protein